MKKTIFGILASLALVGVMVADEPVATVIRLCDNVTELILPGIKPGRTVQKEEAVQIAQAFMGEWQRQKPGSNWIMASYNGPKTLAFQVKSAAPAQAKQGGTYSGFDKADEFVWKSELDKFVAEGNRIFHDAEAFGGTVSVSCDMCHPNAANTHPETYPKYQVQMQKVALLRDMINWCISHPAKGKALADDDPRLRAMEAYITSQRAGKVMEPGKH